MDTPVRLFLLLTAFLIPGIAYATESNPVLIDFVMAHKPGNEDNVALIQAFADRVKNRTKGGVIISPETHAPQSGEEYDGSFESILSKVYTGEIAMSQISVKKFADISPVIDVLDMPMVFHSHDHASRVLDGEIGKHLRHSVHYGSNGALRGLAFTYSGGFRDIYTTRAVKSVAELKGMPMRLRSARSGRDPTTFLGFEFFSVPPLSDLNEAWIERHSSPEGLAEEAELNRIMNYREFSPEMVANIKTILETRHSLYLTLIVINGPMFDQLTADQRKVLEEEAAILARQERELSIRQEAEAKKILEADGITFVSMSDEDRKLLDAMGAR